MDILKQTNKLRCFLILVLTLLSFYFLVCPAFAIDSVPNFAASPSIISAASGEWSDPNTWNSRRIPTDVDVVRIAAGTTVTIDDTSAAARVIGIEGTLRFSNTVNTHLVVGTILVHGIGNAGVSGQTGTFEMGTDINPIQSDKRAELIFADGPLESGDTEEFSRGLIAFGVVRIHGAKKDPTFIRVSVEPKAGQTQLALTEPAFGWRVGDRVFLPDSRMLAEIELPQPEEFDLVSVSADGRTLTVSRPLAIDHPGARDGDDNLELQMMPHAVNMTRNVLIKSQNPAGMRGHLFLHHRADIDIRYAQIQNMGRTRWDQPLGPGNHIGRYPLHLHHLVGPQNLPVATHQFSVVGNAILDDDPNNPHKWPIVIHNSHYGFIAKNVVLRGGGWGIGFEALNESFNHVIGNFVAMTVGNGQRDDVEPLGSNGVNYWLVSNNTIDDNVSVHSKKFQMAFWTGLGTAHIPAFKGADPAVNGAPLVMHQTPILSFARNEIYGSGEGGLIIWYVGARDSGSYDIGESVVKDLKLWHTTGFGIWLYPSNHITFDGVIARGDKTMIHRPRPSFFSVFNLQDYLNRDMVIRNSNLQNANSGIMAPVHPGDDKVGDTVHLFTAENNYLRCYYNFSVGSTFQQGAPTARLPRKVIIRNCRFELMDVTDFRDSPRTHIALGIHPGGNAALMRPETVEVYAFNGDSQDNFVLFKPEQGPDFVVPQRQEGQFFYGAPEFGLTNAQVWAKYKPWEDSANFPELELKSSINPNTPGAAIAGRITPCLNTRDRIYGYVCSMESNAPQILTQPADQTVDEGQTATFQISAVGNPSPSYQWRKNGVDILGATSSLFTTPPVTQGDNGALYQCSVSNAAGGVVSQTAKLNVRPPAPPTITQQPLDQGVTEGQSATFRVAATGTQPLEYQWLKKGVPINGATQPHYTTPATTLLDNGNTYICVVSNPIGSTNSSEAKLTVLQSGQLRITQHPANQAVHVGETAFFQVRADGTPPPQYQWQVNGQNILGATEATFRTSATELSDNGKRYRILVSNTAGTLTSNEAILTVSDVSGPVGEPSSPTSQNPNTLRNTLDDDVLEKSEPFVRIPCAPPGSFVDVIARSGKQVKQLICPDSDKNYVEWDGTDNAGHPMPSQTYGVRGSKKVKKTIVIIR